MFISIRPRAGSADVDLNEMFVEIADNTTKKILNYSSPFWNDSLTGVDDLYSVGVWSGAANEFGILVIEDADSSCSQTNPTVNRGDRVMLCIDLDSVFPANGIGTRTDIWGAVVPETGSPGVISFTSPASFGQTTVHKLQ
jgi:flagellin FlaB